MSRGGLAPLYDMAGVSDIYEFLPVDTVRLHAIKATQRQASSKRVRFGAGGSSKPDASAVTSGLTGGSSGPR